MAVKWATTLYRTVLLPSFAVHFTWFQRKAALDRALEKLHPAVNVALGVLFGTIIYLIGTPLRPSGVDKSLREMQIYLVDCLAAMQVDFKQEFYPYAVQRIKSEIISRALVARDEGEARKYQLEVQRHIAEVKALKGASSAAAAAATPAATTAALPEGKH
jgi:hypothetical protein